ncbi:MAG TPA: LysE family transporter [Rhodocyclaceae bacterium]|nr:LysE family transporter [Rhodocyclaceae bacterium]
MPFDIWLAFLVACLAISISPGPGAFASMAAGLRNGFLRGYWVVLGLQLGILFLLGIVAVGVGALVLSSVAAFEVLRWGGAIYLAWLGIAQWFNGGIFDPVHTEGEQQSRRTLLIRGFLVDASNPKALLFLFAVVPQFIDPALPLLPQYAAAASTVVAVDMLIMAIYTVLAARAVQWLQSPTLARRTSKGFGLLFLGAAASLATFRRSGSAL